MNIQNQSGLIPIEFQLLKQNIGVQLPTSYIPQQPKLCLISNHKRIYITSMPDRYQHIRILIFTVLRDCYVKFEDEQKETIRELKKILYSQNLNIDPSSGSKKKILNKYLLKILLQIPPKQNENTQKHIFNLFNNEIHFDKAIILPIKQAIQFDECNIQNAMQVKQWFQQTLNIKLPVAGFQKKPYLSNEYRIFLKQKSFLIQSMRSKWNQLSEEESLSYSSSRMGGNGDQDLIDLTIAKSNKKLTSETKIKEFKIQNKKKPSLWDYLCCNE